MPKAVHSLSAEWPMVSPVENSATAGSWNIAKTVIYFYFKYSAIKKAFSELV